MYIYLERERGRERRALDARVLGCAP